MRKSIPAFLGFGLVIFSALHTSQALDLTPRRDFWKSNEYPAVPIVRFTDKDKHPSWFPPTGWLINGGGGSLTVTAPDESGAWMKFLVVPRQPAPAQTQGAQPPTDPAASASAQEDELQTWAAQFVPPGAKDVKFEKTCPSPFTLGQRESTEFIFSFSRYGSRDFVSISVVNYSDTERLVIIISAGKKDFEKTRDQMMRSLGTWGSV